MGNVVIWGAGKYCEVVVRAIRKENCKLIGIVDSDKTRQGTIYMNKWIIDRPEVLIDEHVDYIVISVQQSVQIIRQCKKMKIEEHRIIEFWKSSEDYDFIDNNVKKIYELEMEVKRCYQRINNMPYELGLKQIPHIGTAVQLLEILLKDKKSLCRFGDGELELMQCRERPWFQKVDEKLAKRLMEIFQSENRNVIIALADIYGSLERYTEVAADEIRRYLDNGIREKLIEMIDFNRKYYDTYVTRPYLIYRDKKYAVQIFSLFRKVWENRNVLIVEGKYAYNGVRNNLFNNTASISRIIAPPKDAFSFYDEILVKVCQFVHKDMLILISLGPTATVLAYDLAMKGFQALDIGQLDNEYEWYLRGAESQIEIPGKCVAELRDCRVPDEIADPVYESQIITRIGI
jgi:glycosyltransferase family protein